MGAKIALSIFVVIYWIGVLSSSFERKEWKNSDPDTWLHGGLATYGTVIAVTNWMRRKGLERVQER